MLIAFAIKSLVLCMSASVLLFGAPLGTHFGSLLGPLGLISVEFEAEFAKFALPRARPQRPDVKVRGRRCVAVGVFDKFEKNLPGM